MRLRWSSCPVILILAFNLVFLLVGCSTTQRTSTAAGLRYPPAQDSAADTQRAAESEVESVGPPAAVPLETGEIPRLLGFTKGTDFPAAPTVVPRGGPDSEPGLNTNVTASGGRIHIGLSGVELAGLDPALAATASELVAADVLFDGLTVSVAGTGWLDGRSVVVPAIASTWGERAGGYWEFVLAQRQFSNGKPITAGDVKASLERALRQAGAESELLSGVVGREEFLSGATDDVSGIRAPDDGVLLIALDEVRPDFDRELADVRLGVVQFDDLSVQSSEWSVTATASNALRLSHNLPDGQLFSGVDLLSYTDRDALLDGYTAGEVEVAMIGGGKNPTLLWSWTLEHVETREDGTFDILSLHRQ